MNIHYLLKQTKCTINWIFRIPVHNFRLNLRLNTAFTPMSWVVLKQQSATLSVHTDGLFLRHKGRRRESWLLFCVLLKLEYMEPYTTPLFAFMAWWIAQGYMLPISGKDNRWEANTRPHLKETVCEGVDWIQLAQDRVYWRDLANTVTNFRVP
jgi:hypothetical protein